MPEPFRNKPINRRRQALFTTLLLTGIAAGAGGASCSTSSAPLPAECKSESGTQIFDERIAPLLADDRPKSCNQCHLSGVDMSLFVRPTPCETMACLRDLGLVDLEDPGASKVLAWIERASPDSSPLITDEVIQAEYDGFRGWIDHYAACGRAECRGVKCRPAKEAMDPFCDLEPEPFVSQAAELDPGGCDDLAIESLFKDTVYASRNRCYPCHFSENTTSVDDAPRFYDQTGNCEAASLRSLRKMEAEGLINTTDPMKSLLLLKPLALDDGGILHGGHEKFVASKPEQDIVDPGYDNYVYFLKRYAECKGPAQATGATPPSDMTAGG
jgi:hypothetical protein